MRLTSFTDFSLRVLIYLGARRDGDRLATISDIADAYGISRNHLMKVVHYLSKEGYIDTTRGKGGGMRLARSPARINIGTLVRATEEDFAMVECFQEGNRNCPIIPVCALPAVLERALQAFLKELDRQTLDDLLKPQVQLVRIFRKAAVAGS